MMPLPFPLKLESILNEAEIVNLLKALRAVEKCAKSFELVAPPLSLLELELCKRTKICAYFLLSPSGDSVPKIFLKCLVPTTKKRISVKDDDCVVISFGGNNQQEF